MKRFIGLCLFGLLVAGVAWAMSEKDGFTLYTEADTGSTTDMPMGGEFLVQLDGNPTTGYAWVVTEMDEDLVKLVKEPKYTPDSVPEGVVGSGGSWIFHFRVIQAGDSKLRLEYRRPWEKDVPAEKEMLLDVVCSTPTAEVNDVFDMEK